MKTLMLFVTAGGLFLVFPWLIAVAEIVLVFGVMAVFLALAGLAVGR